MFTNISPLTGSNPVTIHLGGSRFLAPAAAPVAQVVQAILATGASIHIGCSVGADAQAIQATLAAGAVSRLSVFAVFGPAAAGAWSGSAVAVVQSAAAAGAAVTWFVGGPQSIPLRARLLRRSVAALAGCQASVFFHPGPGSLAVAAQAVQRLQPVFAICPQAPAPVAGQPGRWQPAQFAGLPAWCWQSQNALF